MPVRISMAVVLSLLLLGAGAQSREPAPAAAPPAADPSGTEMSSRDRRRAGEFFRLGEEAMAREDALLAARDFENAAMLDPSERRYRVSSEIARQYAIADLLERAQNAWSKGQRARALQWVEEAYALDPESPAVTGWINTLAGNASLGSRSGSGEPGAVAEPAILQPGSGRHSFRLHGEKRNLITEVFRTFGILAMLDTSVNFASLRFDLEDADFSDAASLVSLATGTFFVPLDAHRVVVVADTRENRLRFERRLMRAFYFPGLDAKELTDMGTIARDLFGLEQSSLDAAKSALTVRATAPELDALDQTYSELLGGRNVVELDVRLYEIDKTRASNLGVVLPASTTIFNVPSEINSILNNNASLVQQLLAADPSLAGNYQAILAALIAAGALSGTVFNSPFAVFGGGLTETGIDFSGVNVNLLLNSTDKRALNEQQVRVLDQEDATIRSGERYPIVTSSYSSLASSSGSAVPQFQYQDLGLTLKLTPHVESSREVSLSLSMKLTSLAGVSLNSIPVLNSREYSGVVSMRTGDSIILLSDLSRQESREITGVPGLGDLPFLSGATNRQDTKDVMELAVVITPHLTRLSHEGSEGPMLMLPRR